MKKTLRNRKGFTLIELMIVVAIIGILAAIAIPNFLRFQLKSKTSEGKVNLAAIRTAEESYLAEFGLYVSALPAPGGTLASTKRAWPLAPPGFNTLGWGPEGMVFFDYEVTIGTANDYTATADADIDSNGTPQAWAYAQAAPAATAVTPANSVCAVAGLASLKQVGPCDATTGALFGNSEF